MREVEDRLKKVKEQSEPSGVFSSWGPSFSLPRLEMKDDDSLSCLPLFLSSRSNPERVFPSLNLNHKLKD